ncbi:MAG: DUF502 domain-containing protein [Planctomycetes bacterium]|nr:DUF502 domain-containing protein [Planctomycetota bacterium]
MTTPEQPPRTFRADFKRFFVRGLVVLLPSVLTLWIMVKAYQFVDVNIADPVNAGIRFTVNSAADVWSPLDNLLSDEQTEAYLEAERIATGLSDEEIKSLARARKIEDWWEARWYMRMIGIIVAIVAVYIAGRLLGGFFGRRIYRKIEGLIVAVPIFKQVYPHIKQVVDFLFSDEQKAKFNRVVLIEYPRKGIWSIGLMTGDTMKSITKESGDAVTVFIPSSPMPATGYTITVPKKDLIDMPITVEEAMRFTISAGVLIPSSQLLEQLDNDDSPSESAQSGKSSENLTDHHQDS